MKLLGAILLACVILRLLQLALAAGLVVVALLILWGAFKRPVETFGLLLCGMLGSLLQSHPLLFAMLLFGAWWLHLLVQAKGLSAAQDGKP